MQSIFHINFKVCTISMTFDIIDYIDRKDVLSHHGTRIRDSQETRY